MTPKRTPKLIRVIRLLRLVFWLISTVLVLSWVFRQKDKEKSTRYTQKYCQKGLRILKLQINTKGIRPTHLAGHLVVANHVSWLDILALESAYNMNFVAKQEIQKWPLIGTLATNQGTVFINRNERKDTAKINQHIEKALQENRTIAVFPEARTSNGLSMRLFKSSLFQSALNVSAPVQPIAIKFYDELGQRTTRPAYIDGISLLQSVWQVLGMRKGSIELTLLPTVNMNIPDLSRHEISKMAHQEIYTVINQNN
ncbi:MAG: 1-acylglycerol-3-phosphate O-acyltransferase [Neisseriaceae bacterium]|nr:1-acylglycerol-3-phosphate O-acyltransferase [Neisseriaceae bacterium]MBP6863500.1 1-acylglycerol-3-phosphate O-acyltransferase [Neisseriaceae bacterium]